MSESIKIDSCQALPLEKFVNLERSVAPSNRKSANGISMGKNNKEIFGL